MPYVNTDKENTKTKNKVDCNTKYLRMYDSPDSSVCSRATFRKYNIPKNKIKIKIVDTKKHYRRAILRTHPRARSKDNMKVVVLR